MKEIRTTADIHATPQRVWEVLTDLRAYPDWNPFITQAAGGLEVGETLNLRLEPPGGLARTVHPVVLEVEAPPRAAMALDERLQRHQRHGRVLCHRAQRRQPDPRHSPADLHRSRPLPPGARHRDGGPARNQHARGPRRDEPRPQVPRARRPRTRALTARTTRLVGYLCALGAGTVWGTTGPLSTALYAEGQALTGIGFWRLFLGTAGLALWALLLQRDVFRIDRRGLLLIGGLGGAMVALFEVAYYFGIAGAGVAGAAALLYTAPVMVALVAKPLLGERLTPLRFALAVAVMIGAAMTVMGKQQDMTPGSVALPSVLIGVIGGMLAAVSYATTTVLARWIVPRYGSYRMLFWEAVGGLLILGIVLPLAGHAPAPPPTLTGWIYIVALAAGGVVLANFLFFAGVRRIEATPTAVAATIEPVAGALLALALLDQRLAALGWIGLILVVGGVAAGYLKEGTPESEGSRP